MLVYDLMMIGNKLYTIRKRTGMTQLDVAVAADISERTYADIERGSANMRIETFLRICNVFHITPDEILTQETTALDCRKEEILQRLSLCSPNVQDTAFRLLEVYLQSLT